MIQKYGIVLIALIAPLWAQSGAASDFASERLVQIASREAQIYKRIAEDPDFYSADDLDRRINDLVQSYRTYLTENPEDVSALVLYGKLLRRVQLKDEAFRAFLKADSLDPTLAVVKQQIGTHLAETGKGKAALPFYFSAVELEPETPEYHFALGQLLYAFHDEFIEESIFTAPALERETMKAFRKAVSLAPENFDFQMRLGEAYYDMISPDWRSALLHWKRMGDRFGHDALRRQIIDLHRSNVLAKLGRYEEAKALAETITEPNLQYSKQQVIDAIAQH